MHSYIIVPDGVAADTAGNPIARPSFIYRQVLDYVMSIARSDDILYLAPANCCNASSEHELAYIYIRENSCRDLQVYCPPVAPSCYVDTYGNAILLKQLLGSAITDTISELICASLHSYRAEYCFKKAGFAIKTVHRVACRTTGEPIMRRWWYYNYKPIHCAYELLALCRDFFKTA